MIPAEQEILSLVRTRGHWEVVIRPTSFVEHRLERSELNETIVRNSVDIRGWDFPHISRHESSHIDVEWVGQQVNWEHQLQIWRMYRSGQFVFISGIPYEWRDRSHVWPAHQGWEPNQLLGFNEVIGRLTEVTDFAARLSQTKAGDESMTISIRLGKMKGRVLFTDSFNRTPLRGGYQASVESISAESTISRAELVAAPRPLALKLANDVFSFFGWQTAPQIAADVQAEILRGR